ncbi:MAG TPA: DinB family protein [Planctomycetota bacterium]|nr:DinB family protein [Planctomycetota bacterium]
MARALPWLQRTFPSTVDARLYPNVVMRIRGTPARLEELFDGADDSIARRGAEGKWSAQEHAGHLIDLDRLHATRLDELLARKPVLTAADMANRATEEANHNARALADLLAEFRRERGALVAKLDALPAEAFELAARHPRLGTPMRLIDMLVFVAEHDDHHLARIFELR